MARTLRYVQPLEKDKILRRPMAISPAADDGAVTREGEHVVRSFDINRTWVVRAFGGKPVPRSNSYNNLFMSNYCVCVK